MKVDRTNNMGYNKNLQANANKLRKSMRKAEACLWKYVLRNKGVKGYQFRRERPVLNYIADFMCIELKLVIEVDGLTHQWAETVAKDNRKDSDLRAAGFTILRFTDNEVLSQINNVRGAIEKCAEEIEKSRYFITEGL